MKKRVLTLLLASVMLVFALSACASESPSPSSAGSGSNDNNASDNSGNENPPAGLTSDEITLTVWESDNGPDEFIKQAGEAFTALYPNITIKWAHVELGDAVTQIGLDGPAGIGPDLFAGPHDRIGSLVSDGHVLPVANQSKIKNAVLGACALGATYNGTMYGYPVAAETYAMFYNKDLIAEADVPTTWEGVIEFAKGFNAPNLYGFMMDVTSAYYTILFTTSDDNLLFGPSGTDTANTFINSPASVKGMEFFQGMREILDVAADDITTAVSDSAFTSGMTALYITGPWNIAPFINEGMNFGIAPLPSLPGQNTPASSFSGTRCMFVSAYSEYPDEAAAFADFLVSEEMQKLRNDITGAIPSVDIPVDSPYLPGLIKQLDYAFPMPSIPEMGKYWDAMSAACKNIWNGADIQSELDAADAAILAG